MSSRDQQLNEKEALHWGLRPDRIRKRKDLTSTFMIGDDDETQRQVERIRIEAAKNYGELGQDWIQCIYGMVGSGSGESLHEVFRYSVIFQDIPSDNMLGVPEGSGYTAAIQGAPLDDDVKLLLHFDGSQSGTVFTDSSQYGHVPSAVGNAHLDVDAARFGNTSLALDGNGDRLSIPYSEELALGRSDFTIDFWINFNLVSVLDAIYSQESDSSNRLLLRCASDQFQFKVWETGTLKINCDWSFTAIPTGDWAHFALCRDGANIDFYVDGDHEGSGTANYTIPDWEVPALLGARDQNNAHNGYIDEFRIIVGKDIFGGEFTPKTLAYDNLDQDYLLDNCGYDGTIVDES